MPRFLNLLGSGIPVVWIGVPCRPFVCHHDTRRGTAPPCLPEPRSSEKCRSLSSLQAAQKASSKPPTSSSAERRTKQLAVTKSAVARPAASSSLSVGFRGSGTTTRPLAASRPFDIAGRADSSQSGSGIVSSSVKAITCPRGDFLPALRAASRDAPSLSSMERHRREYRRSR
jgi:hypothetical protein